MRGLSDKAGMDTQKFKALVVEWAEKLKVRTKEIHVRPMKNKWASLSSGGRLTFNSELLDKRRKMSDYVIVHELIHIKVPNHGKLFKSLMYALLPDWEKLEKEINKI